MKKLIILILILALLATGCSPDEPLTDTVYFTDIEAEQIMLGGAPLLIPAYGEIYNTAFLNVACANNGTFYPVHGVTTSGEILGFANDGNGRLTYTDITPDRICLINTAMTVSMPVPDRPATISAQIYKNGVPDPASLVGDYIGVGDPAESLPIVCLIELLSQGDYLEIYVSSSKDGVTVVVNTMTLIATTVD